MDSVREGGFWEGYRQILGGWGGFWEGGVNSGREG